MMERRFDMSDFEQSLKDHADHFVMVPSKRVWNGIYNNLHPGSKWPSISVAIVLIIALVTIGNFNNSPKLEQATNSGNGISEIKSDSEATINKDSYFRNDVSSEKNKQALNDENRQSRIDQTFGNNEKNINANENEAALNSVHSKTQIVAGQNKSVEENKSNNFNTSPVKSISVRSKENKDESIVDKNSNQKNISMNILSGKTSEFGNPVNKNFVDDFNSFLLPQKINTNPVPSEIGSFQNLNNDILLNETYHSIKNDLALFVSNRIISEISAKANYNQLEKNVNASQINTREANTKKGVPSKKNNVNKKRNKNIEWIYYVTPLFSTATFRGKATEPLLNNYSPIVIYQSPSENGMIYNSRLGFETGAKMTYALSKKWKFITGANLNYSSYHIVSNLLHPTFATLMLKNNSTGTTYSESYVTYYGNGQSLNQVPLTNYNLQISTPVGLQFQIWGNNKIQLNVASTIEPSMVVKSQAYIISADKRYYVKDPDLMRRMNINGNFGAFITFTSKKMKWHIGPDFRYQLLSTYKNSYPVKEHLIDYGIRIGMSK
jgi:uncharacterized protein YycO